jgi:hypothetical protein
VPFAGCCQRLSHEFVVLSLVPIMRASMSVGLGGHDFVAEWPFIEYGGRPMAINFPKLGATGYGRLGNQLWQVAGTIWHRS